MVRVSSKGQIVLPKELREHAGISEGDYIKVEKLSDGKLVIQKSNLEAFEAILERFQKAAEARNFTREDLEAAIEEVRRERNAA
jgi:antitoxin PrlF